MSHIPMSHDTHVNESRHTCEWVMSHMWTSHVTHERVMTQISTSHVTHMNESRHASKWVTSHIWMSHGTHINKSWHTYGWVTLQALWYMRVCGGGVSPCLYCPLSLVRAHTLSTPVSLPLCLSLSFSTGLHDASCMPFVVRMCDMTHSSVWTWLIHLCGRTHLSVRHDSFICVKGLMHLCDMTHSFVWHDSCICVTWLIHERRMPCKRHHASICVTWLIHMCDTTHSYVW